MENRKFIRQIVEAAGRYCDVVAINYYGAWTPSEKTMKHWGRMGSKTFHHYGILYERNGFRTGEYDREQVLPFKLNRNVDMPISILF